MKKFTINLLSGVFFALLMACSSGQNMTGMERSRQDQKYYNYEAAMKRQKKADKKRKKEYKREERKSISKNKN